MVRFMNIDFFTVLCIVFGLMPSLTFNITVGDAADSRAADCYAECHRPFSGSSVCCNGCRAETDVSSSQSLVPEITYCVSSGTLNSTHSLRSQSFIFLFIIDVDINVTRSHWRLIYASFNSVQHCYADCCGVFSLYSTSCDWKAEKQCSKDEECQWVRQIFFPCLRIV